MKKLTQYNFSRTFYSLHNLKMHHSFSTNNVKNNTLDQFGRPLPPKKGDYYVPSLTCDAVVVRRTPIEVLMITRKGEPYKDCLAFPGGFVDYNEDPTDGCLRELKEETSLIGHNCELLTVRGAPQRDPREHIVSIFYRVQVDSNAQPVANDDAADARFYPLSELLSLPLSRIAFDHLQVLQLLQNQKKPST